MTIKILLIDDDELYKRTLSFHLEQAGYHVFRSAKAEESLALSWREKPELILLDIGLPGMDGLVALRHFEQHVGVPVIICFISELQIKTFKLFAN